VRRLDVLVPDAKRIAAVDGAFAASLLDRPGSAVVGPAALGERAGWTVLVDCVADVESNTTTFELLLPQEAW
jgi:hypothetical protein